MGDTKTITSASPKTEVGGAHGLILLGASGSVGRAIAEAAVASAKFSPIVIIVRRAMPDLCGQAKNAGVLLHDAIVPTMDPESLETACAQAMVSLGGTFSGLSTLGVGAGTAKMTYAAHRAIDCDLNAAFARALKRSGQVRHLGLMSAVGANPRAASSGHGAPGLPRYARVKGDAEEAVRRYGPDCVSIFRPAMILGSQHTPWLMEKIVPALGWLTPSPYKSIGVQEIARAMLATCVHQPTTSSVYHYAEMIKLGKSFQPFETRS